MRARLAGAGARLSPCVLCAGLAEKFTDILTHRYVDPGHFDPDDKAQVNGNKYLDGVVLMVLMVPMPGVDVPGAGHGDAGGGDGPGDQLPAPPPGPALARRAARQAGRVRGAAGGAGGGAPAQTRPRSRPQPR